MASTFIRWNFEKWSHSFANNTIVRAGVAISEPWGRICAVNQKSCPDNMPGINVEFFQRLMLRLNLKYVLSQCHAWEFTRDKITGCPRDLIDNKLDVIVGPSSYSAVRDEYVDYTRPVVYFRFGASLKKQLTQPVAQDPTTDLSGALLILLTVLTAVESVTAPALHRYFLVGKWRNIFALTFCVYILVFQSTTFVLYNNVMTSRALMPHVTMPFQSFDELVIQLLQDQRRLVGFAMNKHPGPSYWEYISPMVDTHLSYYDSLKKYLMQSSDIIRVNGGNSDRIKMLNDNPKLTILSSAPTAQYREALNPSLLAITETEARPNKWYSYMVQNGSTLKALLSDVILYEVAHMRYENLIDKYVQFEKGHVTSIPTNKALTIQVLYVPAGILMMGYCISLAYMIIVEKLWHCMSTVTKRTWIVVTR